MKKTYRLFCTMCMAGVLAFLATSCKKNDAIESKVIRIAMPEFTEEWGEPDEADRAYIAFNSTSPWDFKWNAYDEIMVYNLDEADGTNTRKALYVTDDSAEGAALASFQYSAGAKLGRTKIDHFFVFYPAGMVANGTTPLDGDNREYFHVNRNQDFTEFTNEAGGRDVTVDPESFAMATELESVEDQFTLHHIFGICNINLRGVLGTVIDSVVVVDNEINLTGDMSLKLHVVNMATFSSIQELYKLENLEGSFLAAWAAYRAELGVMSEPTGKSVAINCHTADHNGVELQGTYYLAPFYIPMRPGALIKGFVINVYYNGLAEPLVINKYATPKNSYRIKAGVCTHFSPDNYIGE